MIVTGGSRGIGAAIARRAGRRGFAVCVSYRARADRADEVVGAIRADGGVAIAVQADVSAEADVRRLFTRCDAQLGPVSVRCSRSTSSCARAVPARAESWAR